MFITRRIVIPAQAGIYTNFLKIAGAAETNVVIPIVSRIIQIERKCSGIARIIPIPAAEKTIIILSLFDGNKTIILISSSC